MSSTKTLVFAGSARRDSVNKKLARAAAGMAQQQGSEVTYIDLADFEMPLYNGDWEESNGLPEAAVRLKALLVQHDRFLISSPEYNSSISPLLKNSIDWCSRPAHDDEPPLVAFRGKVAGLLAASPGGLGGLRGLTHVREILGNIGVIVSPTQYALSDAYSAFDESGALTDESAVKGVNRVVTELLQISRAENS